MPSGTNSISFPNNFDVFIDPLNVNHFDNIDSVLNDVLGPLSAYDDFLVANCISVHSSALNQCFILLTMPGN